jgi:leader peptidase (prepilin peptidase)/N-methyltransferase
VTANPAAILLFPMGLIFGSFATVVAHRVPKGESFVTGRSHCPHCGATVAAYDNIPVLSWLLLRGRCRSCHERISARYPLTELSLGLLWVLTYLVLGTDDVGELILGLILCALLVTITVTDLERRIIPNSVLLAGAVAGAAVIAVSDPSSLVDHAIAAAVAGGALFLVVLAYPRGMGMGDAKLAAVLGLYLGRSVAPALLIAFAAGAIVGVAMMIRQGAAARKLAIPFGPFLALGGIVGLLAGNELVDAYLNTFANG